MLTACQAPLREDRFLVMNMMKRQPDRFQFLLDHKDDLEIQIIYTQINRDAANHPTFKSFYFNVDSACYFYPASTVKLPMVLLALEKLKRLNIHGLTKNTFMFHDSLYSGQIQARRDTTSETCLPSVAHYAKKVLLTSDNDAHNRLYEFMGQKAANDLLHNKGYTIRILHRLSRPLIPDQNRHTEAVCFSNGDSWIYSQPMLVNDSIPVIGEVLKGRGYVSNDTLFEKPLNFSYKNFYPLAQQQQLLRAILFPTTVSPQKTFDISEEDRKFVMKYMSQLPTETLYPDYAHDTLYYPAYCKFLMYGDTKDPIPSNIRIFNKIGDAYGYMIDNAYIVDFENKVEFMLSAVIATNTSSIYDDKNYEYKMLGFPFMKDLGQLVYHYELKRPRNHVPDLREFRLEYDRQNPGR
jgi:Beta-lactamase enzyme family